MNDRLIANINGRAKSSDKLYLVGDFVWGKLANAVEIRNRIHCKRIILIRGNHDKYLMKKPEYHELFENVFDLLEIKCGKHFITLCHYPLESWNKSHYGALHLHGHVHGEFREIPNRLNIAVSQINYRPISYGGILMRLGL